MHELKHSLHLGAEREGKHAAEVVKKIETNLPYYLCECKTVSGCYGRNNPEWRHIHQVHATYIRLRHYT